jgi:lyso-ornithine lipid O-acyltransferase
LRSSSAGETANEIGDRLAKGDAIVLFAEGTSSDGNRVLPFKTSLFAAVKPSRAVASVASGVVVQTVSIVYTRLHGLPLGRADRPLIGWYGDMDMQSHAWRLLKAGPLDVMVRVGPPVSLESFTCRKALAERSETAVREAVVRILRGRPEHEALKVIAPARSRSSGSPPVPANSAWR